MRYDACSLFGGFDSRVDRKQTGPVENRGRAIKLSNGAAACVETGYLPRLYDPDGKSLRRVGLGH